MPESAPAMDMDVSPAAMVNATVQMQQAQVLEQAQVQVIKKAIDIQAENVLGLLQALPGNLPLAQDGAVGTKLNLLA